MASFRLTDTQVFPEGFTVRAWRSRAFSPSPPQLGQTRPKSAPSAEGVFTDGQVELTGLEDATKYFAGVEVNGSWRWVLFFTPLPEAGTGTGGLSEAEVRIIAAAEAAAAANAVAASASAALTAGLALKAPIASPAFTGGPTAPPPPSGDNTERIATTAWVRSRIAEHEGGGGGSGAPAQFVNWNSFTYEGKSLGITAAQGALKLNGFNAASGAHVITATAHGLNVNQPIVFRELKWGTGTPNLSTETVYWIVGGGANGLELATTMGGAAITLTGQIQGGLLVVDAGPIIELAGRAAEVAFSLTGGCPGVSCAEAGAYYIESFRPSSRGNERAYPKIVKAKVPAVLNCGVHHPARAALFSPTQNHAVLRYGPSFIKNTEARRTAEGEAFQCSVVGTEPQGGQNVAVCAKGISIEPDGEALAPWLRSKTPPPLPDGWYSGSTGVYSELSIKGARFRFVGGANHRQISRIGGVCWAQFANTNWGSYGAITGNDEYEWCVWSGGFTGFYLESDCSVSSSRIYGGWGGFSTKGPLFYKPVTGLKKSFLKGVHFFYHQLESGRGPFAYNEDRKGLITKLTFIRIQGGGADPPMGAVPPSEIYLGYAPTDEPAIFDAAIQGYITAGKIKDVKVIGGAFASIGFGPGGALIVGSEEVGECELGDITEPLNKAIGRGLSFINAPIVSDVTGEYTNTEGLTCHVNFVWTNRAVRTGEVLRFAPASEGEGEAISYVAKAPYGVQPYDKAGAVVAGVAMQPLPAGSVVAVQTPTGAKRSTARLPIARLGFAEGEAGSVQPVIRSGKMKLPATFQLGTGSGSGHAAPVVTESINPWRGSIFVTSLGDLTGTPALSFGANGTMLFPRQLIARGTTTTFKAKLTAGSNVVTLPGGSVTGIAAGFRVTGTNVPVNTIVELVDTISSPPRLQLSNAALATSEPELTVVAPRHTIEGVKFGSTPFGSTQLGSSAWAAKPIEVQTLTGGAASIEVDDASGLPQAGTVVCQLNPWSQRPFKTHIEYTSIVGNVLKGCKANNLVEKTLPVGTLVVPLSTPKVGSHARLFRACEVEEPKPPKATYTGAELLLKSSSSATLTMSSTAAFPTAGTAQVVMQTTLAGIKSTATATSGSTELTGLGNTTGLSPGMGISDSGGKVPAGTSIVSVNAAAKTLVMSAKASSSGATTITTNEVEIGATTTKIPVVDASVFPTTVAYNEGVIVKIEVGKINLEVTGVDYEHNELTILKGPTHAKKAFVGSPVFAHPVAITWTGKTAEALTGVKATFAGGAELHYIKANDTVEGIVVSGEGGVVSGTATVALEGTFTNASKEVTALTNTAALSVGMPISGPKIAGGTTILSVNAVAKTLQMSANATSSGAAAITGTEVLYMGYKLLVKAKGKYFLAGLQTPGGGFQIASGQELSDATVLKVIGSGFPTGPASAIVASKGNATSFTYERSVNAAGVEGVDEGEEPEEPESGEGEGEPGEGDNEEPGTSSETAETTYFVGVANVLEIKGAGGSSGTYSGGGVLAGEVKSGAKPTTVTIGVVAALFPTAGTLLIGKEKVPFTGNTGTALEIGSYTFTETHLAGAAVTLSPGDQVAIDEPLRVAYGERTAAGDVGVVRVGGSGDRVGTALSADVGGAVLALV